MISYEAPSKYIRCVRYELRSFRFGRGPIFSQYPASGTVTGMFKKDPKLKRVTRANIAFTCNGLLPTYGLSLPGWNALLTDRLSFSYRYGGRFGWLNFPEISGIISFCNFSGDEQSQLAVFLRMSGNNFDPLLKWSSNIAIVFVIWIAEPFWKGTVGIALHLTVAVIERQSQWNCTKFHKKTPFIKMCGPFNDWVRLSAQLAQLFQNPQGDLVLKNQIWGRMLWQIPSRRLDMAWQCLANLLGSIKMMERNNHNTLLIELYVVM